MLTRTFCHIDGVGATSEQRLWDAGVRSWSDAAATDLPGRRGPVIRRAVQQSQLRYERRDTRYFAGRLPTHQQWRLFADFRDNAAYLDIETTGLGRPDDCVTTIALYDGRDVRHYVQGRNLEQFELDAAGYDLLVTYNGKSFDVPFLRKFLRVHLDQAHVDLMHVLRSLGHRGGLKAIEQRLGYARPGMEDIDGYVAALLWHEYERRRDPQVLETLLAYNVQDVLTLEHLMVEAFNTKLEQTPFAGDLRMPAPTVQTNPFRADPGVVRRVVGGR